MPALRRGTCFSLEPVSQVTRWQRDCARRNRYAARRPRARCNVNMTGFNKSTRTRALLSVPRGAEPSHTLPRDAGATARRSTSGPDHSKSEGTDSLTYRPEGRRPRSCRRTPRVSPLVLVGATLGCAVPPLDRVAPGFRKWACTSARLPRLPALRTSCRVSRLPAHVRILPKPQSARRTWVASHRFLGRAGWFHRLV